MPAKNTAKLYVENGYYHIYNRGVNKQSIFLDEKDYRVFLSYLKDYLTPKDKLAISLELTKPKLTLPERNEILKKLSLKNYSNEILLYCFALMQNHFHFVLKQKHKDAIDHFTNSFLSRYSVFFNKKYHHRGHVFESTYKAVLVENEPQLLELTRYVHKQAIAKKQPCSYKNYLGERNTTWINTSEILSFFSKTNLQLSYKSFVEEKSNIEFINHLVLEEDD